MRYLRVPHAPLAEILIGALLLATVLLLAVVLRTPRVTAYRAAAPRRPRGRTWPTVIGLALVVPLLWSLLTWPILQPSRHSLRNWRAAVPVWLVNAFVSVGFAQAPLAPMNPDINRDGVVDVRDLAASSACFMRPISDPGCGVTDVNHDNQNSILDIVRVAVRWYQPFTRIADSSPTNGEDDVSLTRETIIRFSAPIDAAAVLPGNFYATFAGQTLSARLYLSSDMKTVTLFYDDDLPASARVRVTINGDAVADANGYALDVRGNGLAGGNGTLDFDTLSLSTVPGTQVCGTVFASELAVTEGGETTDVPLAGVRITVDGAEASMLATSANDGTFCLNPAPAGSFFVHIDGRTAINPVPPGAYYPFVGKEWASVPGQSTNIANVYLPLIAPDTLQAVSTSNPTTITFPAAVIQAHPELSGTQIIVPADSLFANNGTRGGSVGIAPVPPDRLPSPLPPELDFPIVITVQTNGPENFDAPAPICMPNLPQPSTGFAPFPGTKMALYSFNHDTGRFEAVAPMTVSADGARVCTDPGYGIVAPGWHGTQPGARGKGGPIKTLPPNNCPGINPLTQCCTSAGPVPRTAVSNLADCPNRIPKPTYVPQPNGCGPEGYGYAIPDCAPVLTALGTVSYICFTEACNAHDVCYGSCNAGAGHKNTCDGNFQDDMRFKCDSSFPIDPIARQNCYAAASVYFNAVNKTSIGNDAYNAGQQEACDCCASAAQAAAAAQPERVPVANPTAALLNQIAPPTDAGQETGAGAGQEVGAISAAQPQSAAAKILLRVTSPDAPAVIDSSLGDLSTGVHYFAIRNWFTDVVVQRGRTGTNGIAHENLNLQARTLYRQYILQPSTLLVGFADFTTPLDGLTIDIPPTYLGNSTAADSDGDGLNDDGELVMGTQVNNPDSDGDGVNDGAEVQQGTDPLGGLIAQTGIIATTQTPGPAVDICAVNNLVAVAEMETGVSIFNVFNSVNPTIMAQVNTPGQAQSVACGDNNLLAVADGSAGLAVIDFSDPPAAFISHQVNLGGSVRAVATAGSLAYAGLTNGNVVVVDMQSGTVLQTISAGAAAIEDLSTEKENLFVLLDSQLRAYSVAQGILTFQGQVATSGYFAEGITGRKRLFVGGGFAYATSYPGYDVFDVQNLAFPVRVGNASTPGPNSFKQIVANGSGLGVATVGVNPRNDGTHDLWLYDVSDPTRTGDLLTTFSTPDVARAVAIYNGLAYVADSAGGMHVISYLAYDTQGIPPTIALSTNFVSGQAEEGKVMRVTAAVADDSQVRSVQFYINDVQTQTDGNFPFEVRFITPRIVPPPTPGRPVQPQDASFTLRARAIDTGGNATWSDTMTVTLTTDATAPQVTLVAPASNSVNIQGGVSAVAVAFSEPVDPASLTAATFRLFNAGNDGQLGTGDDQLVSGGVIGYRSDVNMAVLSFGAPLPPQLYRVDVATGVTDLVGNALLAAFSSTFRVNQPVTWVSDNSGFWDVGSNWSGGSAPTASDFVVISRPSAAITVTVRFGGATARSVTSDETLEINGGVLTVATPSTSAGPVKVSGGTLGGGDWVLQSGLAWSGGTLDVPNAHMTVNGAVSISGSATKSLWRGTLDLLGTTTWSGSGAISLSNGAVINNQAGATFNAETDQVFTSIQLGGTFNNSGAFRKQNSAGTTTFTGSIGFNNYGNLQLQSGTLAIASNGAQTGDAQLSAGTVLQFTGGTYGLNNASNISGGDVLISNATVNINGQINVQNLRMTGGTLGGSGMLTTTNIFTWTAGSWNDNGTTVIPVGATLVINGSVSIWQHTVHNRGTTIWSGASDISISNGSVFNNLAGALFEAQNDRTINSIQIGGVFNNAGVFRKLNGAGNTTVTSVTVNNSGSVEALSGTLGFVGGYSQSAGSLTLGGGNVQANGTLALNGGSLNGVGTVTANVSNSGQIAPGNGGAGALAIVGAYTQAAGGTLNIELGGLTAGSQHDQLTVSGAVTLNGTLNVTLINGFSPAVNDNFIVLTYASRSGTFSAIAGNGNTYSPLYNAGNLTLVAQ